MNFRRLLCFVLLLQLSVANAQQPCEAGLDCWLRSITISINDYTITQNQSTLVIKQTTCTNISITDTKSSFNPPYSLEATYDNARLNCAGEWTYTSSTNETSTGSLSVIASGIEVTVGITNIPNATYGFVGGVDASCKMGVPSISFIFNNNTNNNIPTSFQNEVQGYFSTQIADAGCTYVSDTVTEGLSTIFDGLYSWGSLLIETTLPMPDRIFYMKSGSTFDPSHHLTSTLLYL